VCDKYLGQVLHSGGVEASATATVQERSGRIKGATMEIRSIVEEYQMQAFGGLTAAWELWERALLPSLLSGAGTWIGECKEAIGLCDQLQNFFWRIILKVPESCPKVSLRSETKMLGMKWRVWQEKLFLLMRIRNHDEDTLCRQIYEEGKLRGWPGLGKEVAEICKAIDIPDVNNEVVTKAAVKDAIFNHHYAAMTEEIVNMTKLEPIKNDDFRETQEYFKNKSIENGRMSFRIRTQMLDEIPGNFKNKFRNDKDKLKCYHCESNQIMTQSHCMDCSAWTDIRKDLDLSKIEDIVKFFQRLLIERAKSENDGLNSNKPHCTTPAPGGNSG
jgi:hypothetical protein